MNLLQFILPKPPPPPPVILQNLQSHFLLFKHLFAYSHSSFRISFSTLVSSLNYLLRRTQGLERQFPIQRGWSLRSSTQTSSSESCLALKVELGWRGRSQREEECCLLEKESRRVLTSLSRKVKASRCTFTPGRLVQRHRCCPSRLRWTLLSPWQAWLFLCRRSNYFSCWITFFSSRQCPSTTSTDMRFTPISRVYSPLDKPSISIWSLDREQFWEQSFRKSPFLSWKRLTDSPWKGKVMFSFWRSTMESQQSRRGCWGRRVHFLLSALTLPSFTTEQTQRTPSIEPKCTAPLSSVLSSEEYSSGRGSLWYLPTSITLRVTPSLGSPDLPSRNTLAPSLFTCRNWPQKVWSQALSVWLLMLMLWEALLQVGSQERGARLHTTSRWMFLTPLTICTGTTRSVPSFWLASRLSLDTSTFFRVDMSLSSFQEMLTSILDTSWKDTGMSSWPVLSRREGCKTKSATLFSTRASLLQRKLLLNSQSSWARVREHREARLLCTTTTSFVEGLFWKGRRTTPRSSAEMNSRSRQRPSRSCWGEIGPRWSQSQTCCPVRVVLGRMKREPFWKRVREERPPPSTSTKNTPGRSRQGAPRENSCRCC